MKTDAKMTHHKNEQPYLQWKVASNKLRCSGSGETPESAWEAYQAAVSESEAFAG